MAYRPCKEPSPDQLAVRGPSENIYTFLPIINTQHRYWGRKQQEAAAEMDIALGTVGETLHRELFQSAALFKVPIAIQRDPSVVECDRRRAIGAASTSLLLRQVLKPDLHYQDGLGLGEAGIHYDHTIIDMMKGPDGMPLDHRLHLVAKDANALLGEWPSSDATNQWYRSSTLYVHRIRPAQPTQEWLDLMEGRARVDFSSMETLLPYLANI